MSPTYQKFLRVVTGILGLSGLFAIAFFTRELFTAFSFWKLLLVILAPWGAVPFLFFAFHRRRRWELPGDLGDSGGAASAPVTSPAPSQPPSLSAGAAAAIPDDSQ